MTKVLIVDDETAIRKLAIAGLRKKGFQILEAGNAQEAVRKTREELPDVVVMDIFMPGVNLDGVRATRLIKQDPKTAHCKVILMSGRVDVAEKRVQNCGADDFLTKPFSPIALRNRIVTMLQNCGSLPKESEDLSAHPGKTHL